MRNTHRTRTRTLRRSGVLATAILATVATTAQPVQAAPPSQNLGPLIEGYQSYVGQSTCDATAKPGVAEFRSMVLAAYPGTGDSGIGRACNSGGQSEHKEGRAWDWRVSAYTQGHIANDMLNWLLATDKYGNKHALARRFGIMYIIWNHRIWRAYDAGAGWQPYTGANPHTDHVHFSFGWPGARKQTSWWSGGSFGKSTVGYYQPSNGTWHLRNAHSGGSSDLAFAYGPANAKPITGDWNADGKTTIGYYQPSNGTFHLRNSNNAGGDDIAFQYGPPNMVPIAGDWDNDGKTTVGYYNPGNGTFHLRNTLNAGGDDASFQFGPAGMVPVAGDWNNDGKTSIGYYNPSNGSWRLRNANSAGPADHSFNYGPGGMRPITGDWNANGKTSIGYYNPANAGYYLRNSNDAGGAEHAFSFGPGGMIPVAGDWNKA